VIVDLAEHSVDEPPDFEVCVAGAGVAGLTIALQLAERGRKVALIEAGGRDQSQRSQDFYRGQNVGTENLPLDQTRLRMLGGSSNHWGGWCRPLDPYDFSRTDLTGSGWPISDADLSAYLQKASAVLGVNAAHGADLPVSGAGSNLQSARMLFSQPPAHLGDRFYDAMAAAPNLAVFLNAAAALPKFDPASPRLTALTVLSPRGALAFECHARFFVLALGTVENIRMLLLWNRTNGDKFANPAMLGRFYMQHLHQELGQFIVLDDAAPPEAPPEGNPPETFLSSTETFLRQSGVGAFRLYSTAMSCEPLVDDLSQVATAATCASVRSGGRLFVTCEQVPNEASRITLGTDLDSFGQPRARLDWQTSTRDADTLRTAALEFGRYLVRAGIGRLKINPAVLEGSAPLAGWTTLPSAPGAAGHQMGGLRMSHIAADGVTDRDCRLWDIDNVYVGGSGVFRSCGHANPTLTLTQLALRLADTLHNRLAAG
jgi:choline dehydrogenase-like flavoprotein